MLEILSGLSKTAARCQTSDRARREKKEDMNKRMVDSRLAGQPSKRESKMKDGEREGEQCNG